MPLSPRKNGLTSLFKKVRVFKVSIGEGFLQSEVLGEVSVLEGGEFGAKFAAKFCTKSSGLFCWNIQITKIQQKLQP